MENYSTLRKAFDYVHSLLSQRVEDAFYDSQALNCFHVILLMNLSLSLATVDARNRQSIAMKVLARPAPTLPCTIRTGFRIAESVAILATWGNSTNPERFLASGPILFRPTFKLGAAASTRDDISKVETESSEVCGRFGDTRVVS